MEERKMAEWEEKSPLYEAYNELHGLAQEFHTPFDAPAILIVGHQTDGKSALLEALMGFQFNHVGGGTKTRRPITLHMNVLQAYIEAENKRLESEPCQFSAKEIIINIEYKYCPNLTIIDTPGLIAPAPGRKNRELQAQARAVESLVRTKMQHKEFIILCLEDCSDWSNATTRRVVMQAISLREMEDVASLENKLGRSLSEKERSRIGVSKLRAFLEELLQKRYMDSVPLIIPLLEKEYRSTTRRMNEINQELSCGPWGSSVDEVKLKEKGRAFHDLFLTKLSLLLKGTVVAPPDKFGETLQDERSNGGAFIGIDGLQIPHKLIPNAGMRLYGGAQYHRAMAEFRFVVGGTKCPPITREEIVNACGVEDIHDGTNYSRTACVIAVAKARDTFEPFLCQLGSRLLHILKRLLPISVYLLKKEGEYLSGHELFIRRVASAYNNFAEATEKACLEKCMEDLVSTTRYVTWSLHNKNRAGLRQFLDSFAGTEQSTAGATVPVGLSPDSSNGLGNEKQESKPRADVKLSHLASGMDSTSSMQATDTRLADLLDSTLWNRKLAPSSERIFNCFLLMPVVDKLPALLREDLESAFEDDLDTVFDISNLRHALGQKKRDTEIELKRIKRLKEKFRSVHKQLYMNQADVTPGSNSQQ
ncbi:hypothetical protein F8388_004034 [Cannabis sativa]|uniref:Dynamin GTPase domain-containing protein n=1 Tax=Cannabis sativa TaxID=3483 RepID=A0A7J6I0T4_CANSA|nr:hypothetical protein F8388_004034 [Cannabis sativa]KAF4401172.1 hypothetical protein G4B88_014013 [Cannabis sativa]